MTSITPLELAALSAVETESAPWAFVVDQVKRSDTVRSRINTGGGFFTDLEADFGKDTELVSDQSSSSDVWVGVEGMEFGLGIILHRRDGVALLEGYAVGPEDTSAIDFAHVRFAIIKEPGPFR